MSDAPAATSAAEPHAPLGHLARLGFALVGASGIDEIATCLFRDLVALPGVGRVGLALSEGGGRRLRFTASDRAVEDGRAEWCLIDAYDDVPITRVVRTGEPVLGARDGLDAQYDEFVDRQPEAVKAMAIVPLPGIGSPIGGLVVYLEEEWDFDESQRRLLDATARRTSEAVRRVRVGGSGMRDDEPARPDETAPTATVTLHDDTTAPRTARHFLRDFLAAAGVSEDIGATAELCLSELVTNAVVHAGTGSELRATLDEALTVAVRDRGGPAPDAAPVEDPDLLRVHGRGLLLVEALADRWGSERDAIGTTVWFSIDLHQADLGPRPGDLDETG